MPQLLVSVRSVEEAAQALAGGADVIDVKEPQLGSLGRADDEVIADVVRFVAGRRPVSAALGELFMLARRASEEPSSSNPIPRLRVGLTDERPSSNPIPRLRVGLTDESLLPSTQGLSFVKCGLARCGRVSDWPTLLANLTKILPRTSAPTCQFVHVAYADWQCAAAPPLAEVVDLACQTPGSVLLLDTHCKTADSVSLGRLPTLLDWLPVEDVCVLCRRCSTAQVRVALAGSLGIPEIKLLVPAQPTWFAVRGAACADGRDGTVQLSRVRDLAGLLREGPPFFQPEFR